MSQTPVTEVECNLVVVDTKMLHNLVARDIKIRCILKIIIKIIKFSWKLGIHIWIHVKVQEPADSEQLATWNNK